MFKNKKDLNYGKISIKILSIIIILIIIIAIVVCIVNFTVPNKNSYDNNIHDYINEDLEDNVKSGDFLMPIKSVYENKKKKVVVTGTVDRGFINIGNSVQIVGLNDEIINTTIDDIVIDEKNTSIAKEGDTVSITLKNTGEENIEIGQVVVTPNSIKAYTEFEADIYMKTNKEGGRKEPILNGYRPQFYFRTVDVTGVTKIENEKGVINPGDNENLEIKLVKPIALEVGTEFKIREGGRVVGNGKVTKIIK